MNQSSRSPVRHVLTESRSPLKSPLHTTFKPSPLNPATSSLVTCTCICTCSPWVKQLEAQLEAGDRYISCFSVASFTGPWCGF